MTIHTISIITITITIMITIAIALAIAMLEERKKMMHPKLSSYYRTHSMLLALECDSDSDSDYCDPHG